MLHIDFLIASDYNEMVYFERKAGRKEGVQAMEFDHGRALPRWFVLTGDIHIEMVDKFSGGNVHPDRVMSQWVLVLMSGGERTFRIYGEEYAVRGNEFFLLPPHVRHCGVKYDTHQAYFVHFRADGAQIAPPAKLDLDSILLPLYGQVPLELHCFDLMEYAVRHRAPPFFSEKFLSSQIRAILYQLSLTMQKRALWSKQENGMAYRILNFIDDNKGRQLQTQDYAEAFGKSYRRLNTIFLSVYGMTIKQMQIILRIDQAKRMLSSGYSIADTSGACGFDDYLYFLKVFKSKTGMTPSQFRSSNADSAGFLPDSAETGSRE